MGELAQIEGMYVELEPENANVLRAGPQVTLYFKRKKQKLMESDERNKQNEAFLRSKQGAFAKPRR
jgi:hypothetical protein